MYPYYVQVIAENYLRNLVEPPNEMKVHKNFLQGLEAGEFSEGFRDLVCLLKQIYTDIINKPEELDMPLKENFPPNGKNKEYTDSNTSLLRYPHTLLIFGYKGTLQPDMTLHINGNDIIESSKKLKVTKIQSIVSNLIKYGFEISGMSKKIMPADIITIAYPENRHMIAALKSMCDAMVMIMNGDIKKSKNLFCMLNYHILENETPKEPKMTVDYIFHALDNENRRLAENFNDFIIKYAKPTIRMGGLMRNDWSCVYKLLSNKCVIMSLNIENDCFSTKLNLANINSYIECLDKYPEEIKNAIKLSGWDCGGCHESCKGGFAFKFEGKDYNKCRCGSFVFSNLNNDTVDLCLQLLEKEINTIKL